MKNIIAYLALVLPLVSFSAEVGSASALRLGFVDLQKALQSVEAGKNAKTALEKEVTTKKAELEKQQQNLQTEAEQFEKKAAILNDSAKAQKQAELQKKFAELQKNAAESQMDLQKRERELTKPLIDELRSIIEAVAREKTLTLVFEKNEGAVLYSQGGEDLTEAVIERFNKAHKSSKSDKKK